MKSLYESDILSRRLNNVQLMTEVLGLFNITNNEVYLRNEIEKIG